MADAGDTRVCPFCGQWASKGSFADSGQIYDLVDCPTCGNYTLSRAIELEAHLLQFKSLEKGHLMAGWIREQNDIHGDRPVFQTVEQCEQILKTSPRRIPDKARALLRHIGHHTNFFGDEVPVHPETDYPMAYAKNPEELRSLWQYLIDRGFIRHQMFTLDEPNHERHTGDGILTADGFAELENANRAGTDFVIGFVAMSFAEDLLPVYTDAIGPAIRAAGWEPYRSDFRHFNHDVVAEIKARIRGCRFVVSECTKHRNGVYYEAGFAEGLGREVIWVCRADDMENSHFDTNHYNHVVWETHAELKEKLGFRIVGTIGRGPLESKENG